MRVILSFHRRHEPSSFALYLPPEQSSPGIFKVVFAFLPRCKRSAVSEPAHRRPKVALSFQLGRERRTPRSQPTRHKVFLFSSPSALRGHLVDRGPTCGTIEVGGFQVIFSYFFCAGSHGGPATFRDFPQPIHLHRVSREECLPSKSVIFLFRLDNAL